MIIAIDFDGTCVAHAYPHVGHDIGAEDVLRKLVACGHHLILWTMRSNALTCASGGQIINPLDEAVRWFRRKDIPLWGVNCNPHQQSWTSSPKVFAQLYIDDAAVGMPLMQAPDPITGQVGRPFVDWKRLERLLQKEGLFKKPE